MAAPIPYPPLPLAERVGALDDSDDPLARYDELGRRTKADLLLALPPDWDWAGKRVLDFGCGAGRTLRHLLDEATEAQIWGCDIDAESIAWIDEHLSPPLHTLVNGELPPVDRPDGAFDLIFNVSVFTHLAASWSAWLLEQHRLLAPGGLLVATFMGPGMSWRIAGEPFDEHRVGMNVLAPGASWDDGGPMILHAPWWLRTHWGRLFDVVRLQEHGFCAAPGDGHGVITLRRREVSLTAADLERPDPDDPREATALAHNRAQLERDAGDLRRALRDVREHDGALHLELQETRDWAQREARRAANAEHELGAVYGGATWRVTGPARAAVRALRERGRRP